MFNKVLIANRGAIATRIIRTLTAMKVKSVVVYHQQDAHSLHVQLADEAYCLGDGSVAETYLNQTLLFEIAEKSGAQAIHPGYGFLSENTEFVSACEQRGIAFIGPTAEQITGFGLKHEAREIAEQAKVPLVPGSPLLTEVADAVTWAANVGYPIMLKSTAGGGGIGMQVCRSETELTQAWSSVKRLGENYFSNDGVFLEKYIEFARHIEVQVFGDGAGQVISLGERDCSAQRRNQKVIEETPAPNLTDAMRSDLHLTAERLMASVNYRNAGTVEFIFDAQAQQFYFLEVNTRLQVEHGVTEQVWGVDLVQWMVQLAAGELDDIKNLKRGLSAQGHAIQVRVYAENPAKNFQPSAGLLSEVVWPEAEGLRIDTWVQAGVEVSALFDPMIAKVICHQADRETAMNELADKLEQTRLYGIATNKDYAQKILQQPEAKKGELLTQTLAGFEYTAATVDVVSAGTQTTLQDFPGRSGYWDVGVPPSGPMDSVAFRIANELVGNSEKAVAMEILLNGPILTFNRDCLIALTGAEFSAQIDHQPINTYQTIAIKAGQTLNIGRVTGAGARGYLAVAGGFDCPEYLGSCSTFTLGQFGGHVGRALKTGDVLSLSRNAITGSTPEIIHSLAPIELSNEVTLRVVYGPHGAPEFFTEKDITEFFNARWQVHYNSSRTGIRLIGPKPEWARKTGGEAGMHPSNIHDNAYAFGTVDFTGDMPVILGPDGPSLGGFVCPVTVITADLWKLGQLKAGDQISFEPVSIAQAVELEAEQKQKISVLDETAYSDLSKPKVANESTGFSLEKLTSPIVYRSQWQGEDIVCRVAGDHFVLIELGPLELDIVRRFQVHALMLAMQRQKPKGVFELTAGVRSLQVHYDSQQFSLSQLLVWLEEKLVELENQETLSVPSRIVHLPLSWNDSACQLAIEKYEQSVRQNAPWCPSNIEFIRRINGLDSIEAVKQTVFDANYLVLGLGDVYLGAPLATPVDPRHRLVTTKYNPARTWTAENSVGIGGSYMCVYGMEGPGGYQFVGRTSQMWNRYQQTAEFTQPWLLRVFDQIKFYPVSESELADIREQLPRGQYPLKIEQTEFNLNDYQQLLNDNASGIEKFSQHRQQAFDEELARWQADGQLTFQEAQTSTAEIASEEIPQGVSLVDSPVSGNVWQLCVEQGQEVKAGDVLMILESMKMEIEIHATLSGQVNKLLVQAGQGVESGQALVWIKET